jgi:hypothetical protein
VTVRPSGGTARDRQRGGIPNRRAPDNPKNFAPAQSLGAVVGINLEALFPDCPSSGSGVIDSRKPTSRYPSGQLPRGPFRANFRVADYPTRTPFKFRIGSCIHPPSHVLAETELFMIQRDKQVHFFVCASLRPSCSGELGWPIGEHCFDRATEPILIKALVAWVHMIAVFAHEVAAPVRPAAVGIAKRILIGQPPGAEDAA